jgi:DNA-binding NarL/FixJ family response regulator
LSLPAFSRQEAAQPPRQLWQATLTKVVSKNTFTALRSMGNDSFMSILIAEDNVAQRNYLREILEREFETHSPVLEAGDGEETVKLALEHRPDVCILDIQMPKLSGVKAARAIWRDFPSARIIFWTQFPHEIYINEIRKIVKSVDPPPAYGFIHKNNPESRFLRFVAAVLEDGADMIDPAFKDSFKRPLLTEFEAEALYYLALGLSNWAIARKCSLSLRGVESRLATLYEKLFLSVAEGTDREAYDKLAYNVRTRAFFEALRRGLLNNDELEKASEELDAWLERDSKRYLEEQKKETGTRRRVDGEKR